MYGDGYKLEKTHDLNHDLTFSAHTINCVCHSIRSMFRVLGIYNFDLCPDTVPGKLKNKVILPICNLPANLHCKRGAKISNWARFALCTDWLLFVLEKFIRSCLDPCLYFAVW